jgi:hypothetical protein
MNPEKNHLKKYQYYNIINNKMEKSNVKKTITAAQLYERRD